MKWMKVVLGEHMEMSNIFFVKVMIEELENRDEMTD